MSRPACWIVALSDATAVWVIGPEWSVTVTGPLIVPDWIADPWTAPLIWLLVDGC